MLALLLVCSRVCLDVQVVQVGELNFRATLYVHFENAASRLCQRYKPGGLRAEPYL